MPSRTLHPSDEYDLTVARNQGLGQLFCSQAQKRSQTVAIVDGKFALTYGQLHAWASYLAQQLSLQSLSKEEPVGIIVQHGAADVVAQMAVIYAGGSCAPMDPTLPDRQIQSRLKRLDARCVLIDQTNQHRDLPFHLVCLDDHSIGDLTDANDAYPVATDLEHCTHLLHTSGTTNEPKAVRIAARSILHVVFHAPFEPVEPTDVVAHVNNSTFDASLFDLWVPLLRGACIAILSKATLLDFPLLVQEIDRLGITVMIITTALLNLAAFTYPRAFAKMRICLFGGETANLAALENILKEGPPKMLINVYGPTECCIFSLVRQVTLEDVQASSVSIGMPIGRTIVNIADEKGQASSEGELWIGGPGVSPGYVNQPEKNVTAFTKVAGLATAGADPVRLYRTGDIVRRRLDGQIDYIGRKDHQVKIRGYRVELGAVEGALLKTGLFAEAVAMKVEIPQMGAGSVLGAYAVPADVCKPPSIDEVMTMVKAILPDYMVPRLELISQMPLNNHAKVDRKRLAELFSQRWKNVSLSEPQNASQEIRSTLSGLWSTILESPVPLYEDDHDFMLLGGTSLQASLLISQIRHKFSIEISLLTLYNNPTMRALTSVVAERLGGRSETLHDETDLWLADSKIADDLPSVSDPVVDWRQHTEGRVFLTGATGFVGAFLLADLLRMPHVHRVGCLVRATDATAGMERLKVAMTKYGLWKECFASKILALPGILEDEYLGLGQKCFEEVALWASVVFHLGARVNYIEPYSMHRSANILGTRNIVRFACIGRVKPIHYVSSISCFGPTNFVTGASTVREDEPLLPHLAALPYDHGYAQSQWVADQLMRRLIDRGFPIAIYRPGFITGHSQTGVCNPDDFFCRLIHGCCEMGCYPRLPNQRKEFVPVDYVNAVILHIAASPTSLGHAYHIVPPTRATSLDLNDTLELVGRTTGMSLHSVSYAEWIELLKNISPKRLLPLQPMLMEKVQDGRTRWELYENMPVYDATNTFKALANYPGGLEFPVLGPSLMKKYITFLQASVSSVKLLELRWWRSMAQSNM